MLMLPLVNAACIVYDIPHTNNFNYTIEITFCIVHSFTALVNTETSTEVHGNTETSTEVHGNYLVMTSWIVKNNFIKKHVAKL